MTAFGLILLVLGWLCCLVGGIWLLVVAARQRKYLWLVLMLVVPFAGLVFVILNWGEAKRPFFVNLAGIPLLFLGVVLNVMYGVEEAQGQLTLQQVAPDRPGRARAEPPSPVPERLTAEPEPAPTSAIVAAPVPAPTPTPARSPAPARIAPRPQPEPQVPSLPVVPAPAAAPRAPAVPAESSVPVVAPAARPSSAASAAPGSVRLEFVDTETPRGEVLRSVRLRITNSFDRPVAKVTFYLGYLDRRGRPLASWTTEHADPEQSALVGPNAEREFVCPAFFMPDTTASVRVQLREVKFADGGEWRPE